jgi:hypothetical protein
MEYRRLMESCIMTPRDITVFLIRAAVETKTILNTSLPYY